MTAQQTFGILAADSLASEGLEWITSQGDCKLVDRADLVDLNKKDGQAAVDVEVGKLLAAGGVHAMIVRSGIKVTAAMLETPGDLKVIARAGVGTDNIDIPAATAKGILVANTAEASTITTAEHAFALMMALLRNIGPAYKRMAEGGWDRGKFKGRQLQGMTLGVVGLGRIGRTVAQRALAFGMQVVGFDPFVNNDIELDGHTIQTYRDFAAMIPHVDVLSFHVPKTPETTGMLNTETFAKCRDGVFVVNAARGGIVDAKALIEACDSGKCAGAALDVFDAEPPEATDPLRTHPHVLVTPHLGASTKEAQTAVSVDAAKACLAYLRGEGISGAVNAGGVRVDLDPTQKRYVDLAQRMSELISPMITRGLAKVTIELQGSQLAPAAGTIERTVLVGLLQRHFDTPLNVINVGHLAEQRNIKVLSFNSVDSKTTQLTITVEGPTGSVDSETLPGDEVRRIVGRIYDDYRPRVLEINGYCMDMIPSGDMVLIQNEDRPGIIGLVGTEFGEANVNIADMTISRRRDTALMVLKIDKDAPSALIDGLHQKPGILKVATVKLPAEC